MPKEGKCPGDCPAENEMRPTQPKAVPVKKSSFDMMTMFKPGKPVSKESAAVLADKKDQAEKLKTEY